MAMTVEQRRALAMAQARARAAEARPREREMGMLLPVSWNADDGSDYAFDSNAGIVGALKRAVTLPGEVMRGEVDPLSQEGIGRSFEFATVASPMNPAIRAGEHMIPGVMRGATKEIAPPSARALREASKLDYEKVRGLNVDYRTSAVNNLSGEIQASLNSDGILQELAPKTFSILGKLAESPEGSVASISGLEAARRAFGNAAKDFGNPTEQLAAKRAMESLDRFLLRSDPATVQRGDASGVGDLLRSARGNYAAAKRSETLTDLTDAAQLRANAANSGQNAGNTTRSRIASLLTSDKQSAGFGPEDLAELRSVNEGSTAANATRTVGNLLGGGGGLGGLIAGALGAAAGSSFGPTGAAVGAAAAPATGRVAKALSNKLTEKALQRAERNTRKRSPLYEAMTQNGTGDVQLPRKADAIIRALLLGSHADNGGGGW